MNVYPSESVIELTVELTDASGNYIENVDIVTYSIIDSENRVIQDETEYEFDKDDTSKNQLKLSINEAINTIVGDDSRDIRIICITVTNKTGGQIRLEEAYGISTADPLTLGENSFMTYRQALRVSMDIPNTSNWDSATIEQRISALMEAKTRICRLSFDLRGTNVGMDRQDYIVEAGGYPRAVRSNDPLEIFGDAITLRDFTPEDYKHLPKPFMRALCLAQVAEADDVLETDSISERRRQGLILETIGEVKQMFSSVLPAQTVVSTRALSYLSPYLSASRKIGRA